MPLTAAQRSNFFSLTAWAYPLWRARSLTLLAGEPFGLAREARLFLGLCRPAADIEDWATVAARAQRAPVCF